MDNPAYVVSILNNAVSIVDANRSLETSLFLFAPSRDKSGSLVIRVSDPSELPRLLTKLRDLGVAFAGQMHGWPPADIFADYRDNGLVRGQFTELMFSG